MLKPQIYINGTGNVSPQRTAPSDPFPFEPIAYETPQLKSIDPGYKEFIPADQIRRMGRIIRMGIAAAKLCLTDAAAEKPGTEKPIVVPDGIITGTGLGCMEDTGKFLASMIRNKEEFLTPTSFIQSTHNTVAGQIALQLQCHGYNFTYVHRGISFESALLDSFIQLETGALKNVLTGGVDEVTADYHTITGRLGHWKPVPVNSLHLRSDRRRGTIAGEGAAFFLLENTRNLNTYASLRGVESTLELKSPEALTDWLTGFLDRHDITTSDVDLVIAGLNGDPSNDQVYHELLGTCFVGAAQSCYKHLCGEYFTSTAFATWMGAKILKSKSVPFCTQITPPRGEVKNILIYNHYRGINHAAILLSSV